MTPCFQKFGSLFVIENSLTEFSHCYVPVFKKSGKKRKEKGEGGRKGKKEGMERERMKTVRDISTTDLKVGCACRKDNGYNQPQFTSI